MKTMFARVCLLFGLNLSGAVPVSGATPLQWSVRMADSEIARRGDSLVWKQGGTAKWDYTVGLFTLSLLKLDGQGPHHDKRWHPRLQSCGISARCNQSRQNGAGPLANHP